MGQLNDIRVLRNILGDGKADEEPSFLKREVPKFNPKRLPRKDMYGRNLEEEPTEDPKKEGFFKKFGKGFQKVEKAYLGATSTPSDPSNKPSYFEDSRAGFIPNFGAKKTQPVQAPVEQVQAPVQEQPRPQPQQPKQSKKGNEWSFAGYSDRPQKDFGVRPDTKNAVRESFLKGNLVGVKPTQVNIPQESDRAPSWKTHLTKEQKTELAQRQYEQELSQWSTKKQLQEMAVQSKALGLSKARAEQYKQEQAIDAQRQKMAMERGVTPLERFFKSTQRTVSPLVENLSSNIGGAFAGDFQSEAATRGYRNAVLAKNAYMEYMKNKYAKKGIMVRGEYDVTAVGTAGEKKRLQELNQNIQKQQGQVASTGFLSGGGATAIRGRLSQTPNLQPFTQVSGGSNLGSYTPEAFGRLGISQGLRSVTPENKWESLIGGGGGADKITQLLGKGPDPTGAREKLKRYL